MQSITAEVESPTAASKRQFLNENLKPGEMYAGLLLGENGAPDAHLIVISGELTGADWYKSMAWAQKIGGSLPTRREQHLLYANAKSGFRAAWYWSCEDHAESTDDAWLQNFGNGNHGIYLKLPASRASYARAVRLITI